jgi:5-methyltetrahydropteroyltriglutamate--homocysteine methyltransferase
VRQRTTLLGHTAPETWQELRDIGLSDLPFHDPAFEADRMFPEPRRLDYGGAVGACLRARRLGFEARPILPGPVGILASGRRESLLESYAELLERLATAGVAEVQLDEPVPAPRMLARAYAQLGELSNRPRLLVCLCSGTLGPALTALGTTRVESFALDFTTDSGNLDTLAAIGGLSRKTVVAALVDDTGQAHHPAEPLAALAKLADQVVVASTCTVPRSPQASAAAVVRLADRD